MSALYERAQSVQQHRDEGTGACRRTVRNATRPDIPHKASRGQLTCLSHRKRARSSLSGWLTAAQGMLRCANSEGSQTL